MTLWELYDCFRLWLYGHCVIVLGYDIYGHYVIVLGYDFMGIVWLF